MKTSTLLMLLGISIIGISATGFASFVMVNGTNSTYIAPAGTIASVAILLGLGQIVIGRALRPSAPEAEPERPSRKEAKKISSRVPASIGTRAREREEEEEPKVISVDSEEPSAWLKDTLEKLAEQGSGVGEEKPPETPTYGERSPAGVPHSQPRPATFPKRQSEPIPVQTRKGSIAETQHEERMTETPQEPAFKREPEKKEELLPEFKPPIPPEPVPEEAEEERPGVRKLQEMEITFVERDGITFLMAATGVQERYPCEDQSIIDYAWRALVRGQKVNVVIENGKVTKLTANQ